jgi:hypothetical protein
MFVDFLPARLGELSYVAMLNRGYRVRFESCVSSLAVSMLFDFIALFFIASGVLVFGIFRGAVPAWAVWTVVGVGAVCAVFGWVIFSGAFRGAESLRRLLGARGDNKVLSRLWRFAASVEETMLAVRRAGVFTRVTLLSLAVKTIKYAGGYCAFRAVAEHSFPEIAGRSPFDVFYALLSAEFAAGLPVPSFMSFGTFETGGMIGFVLLGMSALSAAGLALALHVLSQAIDYALGGIALAAFFLKDWKPRKQKARGIPVFWTAVAAVLLVFAAGFGFYEYRRLKKMGRVRAPSRGEASAAPESEKRRFLEIAGNVEGILVWSSNRSGNHDLWMRAFPDGLLDRLTDHPHTETYPRISPDGKKVVFCRSREPWVSQRDYIPWDVVVLDLETRACRLAAEWGNTPTWSADGEKVYFQRNADSVVEHELSSGRERVLFHAGKDGVPEGAVLETPDYFGNTKTLAVTLRGTCRMTALLRRGRDPVRVGGGCQLAFSPTGNFLYYVDHGGKQQNAVYRFRPDSNEKSKWIDLPGEFSHEYFPKLSPGGELLVFGASTGGHEHDSTDYEIFLWKPGTPAGEAARVTFHTGNDCWPDIRVIPRAGPPAFGRAPKRAIERKN